MGLWSPSIPEERALPGKATPSVLTLSFANRSSEAANPYINDARDRTLMLLSGETGREDWEGHDWFQLLSRTGTLPWDHALARCCWTLGALLMLAALVWGGYVLWRQARPGVLPIASK